MQIYIVRHDNFLLARYKIWLMSLCCLFREALIKLFYPLQNCGQQRLQKILQRIITQTGAMAAISSSNRAAKTHSKKPTDMKSQKFLIVPCVTFR